MFRLAVRDSALFVPLTQSLLVGHFPLEAVATYRRPLANAREEYDRPITLDITRDSEWHKDENKYQAPVGLKPSTNCLAIRAQRSREDS